MICRCEKRNGRRFYTERCSVDFSGIIGQKEITDSLKNALKSGKTGHAYIFAGPRGIGKKTVARIFCSLLSCAENDGEKSCGKCLSCRLIENRSNPDYHEINPEDGSIGVDEIRGMLGDMVVRPMYSQKKVYLIIDAERMTVQAQNSLLKTLEEPPSYGVMVLTTSNYGALLETIRSRAIKYSFKKNSREEVKDLLGSKLQRNPGALDFVASYAGGIIGTALELAGSEEFGTLREKTLEILLKLRSSRLSDVFDNYAFFEANRDNIDLILDIALLFYRDVLVFKTTGNENLLINSDKKDIIFNNASVYSESRLMNCIENLESARRNIKQNANYQLSMEVMLMKLQEEEVEW